MSTDTPEQNDEPTEPTEQDAAVESDAPADSAAEAPAAEETPAPEAPAEEEAAAPAEDAPAEEAPAEEAAPVAEEAAETEPAEAADAGEGDADPSIADSLDIGSTAVESADVNYSPVIRGKVDRFGVAMGTGRRKTSVARVRIKDGSGEFKINGREVTEYLPMLRDQKMVEAPLRVTETFGKVDVWVRVSGGGTTGQTGAIVLGVARALQVRQPELHHTLSEAGLLTRDGRMVERKKYGLRKARRSFQFSKR